MGELATALLGRSAGVQFVRDNSYMPLPRQREAHAAPERFKLYGGAMGGGKSVWLCQSARRACLRWPGSRWYLARKEYKSFKRTTFLTLESVLERGIVQRYHKSDSVFYLVNGSSIWFGGLGTDEDKEKIKSMELTGFGIDEASEVEEALFLMLGTRLRLRVPPAYDGLKLHYQGLLASNPEPGWLRARFIDQVLPNHRYIPALPRENIHLPEGYEDDLRELFKGTPSWAKAYLDGDWDAFGGVNFVLQYADVRDAARAQLTSTAPNVIGVDVARYGDDETVLIRRRGPVVTDMRVSSKEDTMQTAGRVAAMYREEPADKVIIDIGGVGAGVFDRCRELKLPVEDVNFGAPAIEKERYHSWASEAMAGALGSRFVAGDIQIPNDQILIAQLTSRMYTINSRGQTKIESKDEMKARGLKSPDRADALMLAFCAARPQPLIPPRRKKQ